MGNFCESCGASADEQKEQAYPKLEDVATKITDSAIKTCDDNRFSKKEVVHSEVCRRLEKQLHAANQKCQLVDEMVSVCELARQQLLGRVGIDRDSNHRVAIKLNQALSKAAKTL